MGMYGYCISVSVIGGLLLLCSPTVTTCPEHCTCETTMRCTNLTTFPDTNAELMDIEFDHCHFGDIKAEDIKAFSGVQKLFIMNSQVTSIADQAFKDFSNLTALDLRVNPLREVTKDMFDGLTSLEHLYLEACELTSLPDDLFSNTRGLKILDIGGNKIQDLSKSLIAGLKLEHLYLNGCGLTSVPSAAISQLGDTLTHLRLNKNQLKRLEKHAFSELKKLKILNLDSCFLEYLDAEAFEDLDHLDELELGYNNLTEIDEGAFDDVKDTLNTVRLNANKLTTLHYSLLNWDQLHVLQLEHNPWNCDCDIHWMSTMSINMNASCKTPEELSGLDAQNATSTLTGCPTYDNGNNATVALAIAIPIILIGVLLIGYYVYKIIQTKRRKSGQRKSVRYSAVYKDTVESAPSKGYKPTSDL